MNTKTFIKNIDDMTKRAFGKLYAEYPDFHLYTVLIYIDIDEDKNRAVCSVGFDDLENSLKRTKIWQDSLHSKDEAKYMDYTRTHNPQDLLLKGVENIECDDINVKEAVTALKTDKSLRIIMSAATEAKKFANMCENSALVVEFSKYYHGRAIYDITLKFTEEEESAYKRDNLKYKILFALILLFLAYKFLF
jgi:hypothetical protein